MLRGIVYGEGFERKKECILFSLKTFSHKTVSNHSVVISLSGLCGLLKALSDVEGERARDKNSKLTHLHSIAWATS